jgi:hypothetical protein
VPGDPPVRAPDIGVAHTEAEVDDLLADHPDDVAATARRLRSAVLGAHPQLTERVRRGWHSINYRDPVAGFVCAVFPTADRVQLVFERGADLPDADGLLTGAGTQVRMLVFESTSDVDDDVVGRYLDLAVDVGAAHRAARARAR